MSEKPLNKVMHSGYGPNDIENTIKQLNDEGYRLVHIGKEDFYNTSQVLVIGELVDRTKARTNGE